MSCSAKVRRSSSASRMVPRTKGTPSGTNSAWPLERSSMTTTFMPSARNARTTWAPMYPAPPVTNQVICALTAIAVTQRCRPCSLTLGRQVLRAAVAFTDFRTAVAVAVEPEGGGQHTPESECAQDQQENGHGRKSTHCDLLPRVAESPLIDTFPPIWSRSLGMLRKIVCVTLPGMSPFEFGVICEVFGIDRSEHGGPVFDFHVTAAEPGPIRTKLGFDIVVHEDLAAADDADLIAIPAYEAGLPIHPEILRVVREAEARGAWVLSVCSGAFVLGEAGILNGRRSTTHWMYAEDLAKAYPQTDVDPDVLFVEDCRVVTGAGTCLLYTSDAA